MAAPVIWSGGLAGSGIDTATTTPVIVSAAIIWLDFTNGSDANAGTSPELPVKTFAQAVTNAASSSIISVVANNAEVVTGTVAINKSVKVVGSGIGSARASFAPASAATLMFNVTSDDVSFESIYFKSAQATTGTAGRVSCANKGLEFYSCQMDSSFFDGAGIILAAGADYFRIDGCSFTAVGPFVAGTSQTFVNCSGTNIGGKIFNTVFDGASLGAGFNSSVAISLTSATRLYIKNLTLVGRTDVTGTGVSYEIIGLTTSGASKVSIT